MTTKYIAKHDGHTWTRTSKSRTYTHAVISAQNITDARAAYIAEIQGYVKKGWSGYDQDFADGAGARFDARIANYPKSSDGNSYYIIHGWAGRLDLAQKLAKLVGIILVAEVVTK
jgi:hypothetical protein